MGKIRFYLLIILTASLSIAAVQVKRYPTDTPVLVTQPSDLSSYLTDAPSDGTTYGRKNATWSAVSVTETDPLSLHLDQSSPQTMTGLSDGYLKLTSGVIGTGTPASGGISRSIATISSGQTAGTTASTDYVYICSSALTLTMPTAVGNTNLYVIKNTSSGIITINTTSAQTIDGASTYLIRTTNNGVVLISDGSNWNVVGVF